MPDALTVDLQAITFDFGNTLVIARDSDWQRTLEAAAAGACAVDSAFAAEEFARIWREERDRQIREDVPEGREADMEIRVVRVLARLRGCPAPASELRWADSEAGRFSVPEEVRAVLEAYVQAFLETTPVPPGVGPMLGRLSERYRLGIISNWPLTLAIERFLDHAGWLPSLTAVVVSQSAGFIKPAPGIFLAAAGALGLESGPSLLHVGDDLGADIGGAHGVGWRAALVQTRPDDSPVPVAVPEGDVEPDLVLPAVLDLEKALRSGALASGTPTSRTRTSGALASPTLASGRLAPRGLGRGAAEAGRTGSRETDPGN